MRLKDFSHNAFAGMFFATTFTRGVLLSVLPLQALALLGDAQSVSVLFFGISVAGICSSLLVPVVIRRIGGYRTFVVGAIAMMVCAPLFVAANPWTFIVGMVVYVFAIATLEVSSSLYIMHCIERQALGRFEPKRILAMVIALSIGPWLGVYLESRIGHWLPFALSALSALLAIAYFRWLSLPQRKLHPSLSKSANPIRQLGRFLSQPRLRLAWGLSVTRSCWWVTFVIYTPIFMELNGQGALVGAAIVSLGSATTLTVTFWGWVGRRYGLRFLFAVGYGATSALTLLVFAFTDAYLELSLLLVLAALAATIVDGGGNVLFFRAVRPWERSEMAGVYLTHRDVSQLAPPGLFAVLLNFFALPVIFLTASAWMFASVFFCRYIPKRM